MFGISTADEAQRCRTRLARAKAPKRPASTTQLACASGCPWPGRRDRVLGAAAKLLQLGARQQKALRLGMRSSLPSRLNLACPAQATGQAPRGHSLPLNRGLGAFASHHDCDAVRAQHKLEGHQHAPKEGPLSKDSRSRSEVERHRLNENRTSEVASGGLPAAHAQMEGHTPPMHANGAADAPRISNTPSVGRDWAVGAFLGRPAAYCARNRVPTARRGTMA